MFAQLFKFTKDQTVYLRWVKFIVCKLYPNKTKKNICQAVRKIRTLMDNKQLLLISLRHDNQIAVF